VISINELIKLDDSGKTTAKELYEFLELRVGDFARWCRSNIVENQFAEENKDWARFRIDAETPTGGKVERDDYKLTIDFAKKLCMVSKSTKGEQARNYFIEVEKRYIHKIPSVSNIEDLIILQAQSMKEVKMHIAQQSAALENQSKAIKQLTAKVETRNTEFYTVAGYASLRGLKIDVSRASLLGRKATKLSQECGVEIGKTHDPRFGHVNIYHLDVLKEIFEKI